MDRVKAIFQTARLALAGGFLLAAMAGAGAADRIAFVVPSATVYPGQIVSDTALLEKQFFINAPAATQYVLSLDQAVGKVARKTLLPGTLTITAMGTPLESGVAGDFIKVRNVDSGIIVSGTVLANGRIQVGMQ